MKNIYAVLLSILFSITTFSAEMQLSVGQSAVVCAIGRGSAVTAVESLNKILLADSTKITSDSIVIYSPYSVSAPSLTSYDSENLKDMACVTVVKL